MMEHSFKLAGSQPVMALGHKLAAAAAAAALAQRLSGHSIRGVDAQRGRLASSSFSHSYWHS